MRAVVPNGVALGELASRLQADETGELKREYCAMFIAAQGEARRRLHEPLPPEDHEMAAALAEGAQHCAEVIDAVWSAMHP
jgi:hypothetical protein